MWSDNIFVSTSNGIYARFDVAAAAVVGILFALKCSYNKIYRPLTKSQREIPIQLDSHVRALLCSRYLSCTACVFVCALFTHLFWTATDTNGTPCAVTSSHLCMFEFSLSLRVSLVHGLHCSLSLSLALALFFYGSCVVRTYTERERHARTHV